MFSKCSRIVVGQSARFELVAQLREVEQAVDALGLALAGEGTVNVNPNGHAAALEIRDDRHFERLVLVGLHERRPLGRLLAASEGSAQEAHLTPPS